MSERPADDVPGRLTRALIPGRPRTRTDGEVDQSWLWSPGRGSLEAAVLLAAGAILFPVSAFASVGFAFRARNRGNDRWRRALVAGMWCGVLGLAVRVAAGFPLVP